MNCADALVKCLEAEGVEYVFGYPGVAITPFYNSILQTDIHTVLIRQEQSAAHAASGYARISGKVGVAVVTSGPGATNLITGIATAFADSIPLVCITGQVDSQMMGSDVFQEADISGACESFVKYSYIVRNAADIPRIIKEAFYIANTGRRGPVLIDLPIDVQLETIRHFEYPETVNLRTYKPTVMGHAVQIKKVITQLERAKRPIICVGGGVHLSHASKEVLKFIEKNDIPVVCTMMGLSAIPTEHPLFYGMVGNNGKPYGNRAMNNADMVIMVGARVADRSISQPDLILENKVLVHIDVDPAEIGKNAGPTIPLVGDIKHVFTEFNKIDFNADYMDWIDQLDGFKDEARNAKRRRMFQREEDILTHKKVFKGVNPVNFIRQLSLAMEKDAIYVAAKIAAPDKQVVAVCGDGGFQMTMQELATITQYQIPVKLVILKNTVLGLVRQYQHYNYKDRFSVIDLGDKPDLSMIAKAYGIEYLKVENSRQADEKIAAFLEKDETMILEVTVDREELC